MKKKKTKAAHEASSLKKSKSCHNEAYCFIRENITFVDEKDGTRTYLVDRDRYKKYLLSHGITNEIVDKIVDATQVYNNETVSVIQHLLAEHSEANRIIIKTQTHAGNVAVEVKRSIIL